jgi:hypothetical protein
MLALFLASSPLPTRQPLMSSENPEIRHPSIPDSGDAEHRNMPGLILLLLLGKKKKYRRSNSHEDYFDKDGIIKRHDKNHRTEGGDGTRR